MAQVRVCHIQCFNANEEALTNFTVLKERSGGAYSVKCMISAFNEGSKEAWIYAQFERIKETVLRKALEGYGFSQVDITLFSPLDYATSASNSLQCVLSKGNSPGFKIIRCGAPSQYTGDNSSSNADTVPTEIAKMLDQDRKEAEDLVSQLEESLKSKDKELSDLKTKLECSEASLVSEKASSASILEDNQSIQLKLEAVTKSYESVKSRVTNFRAKEREIERLQGQLGTAEFLRKSSEEQNHRQVAIIREKDAEIAKLKRAQSTEGGTERERQLEQTVANLQSQLAAREQDMKELRRKHIEQGEQMAVQRAEVKKQSAEDAFSVRAMQQRQLEITEKYEERCRVLSARISELEGGKLSVVEAEAKRLRDRNRALAQQVECLAGPGPTDGLYDALYAMAQCMNRMGKEEETSPDVWPVPPRITFQDRVKTLVQKCLAGSGVGQQDMANRQHEVFVLLNVVYCAAMQRGEEVANADRTVRIGMVKVQRKRPRGGKGGM